MCIFGCCSCWPLFLKDHKVTILKSVCLLCRRVGGGCFIREGQKKGRWISTRWSVWQDSWLEREAQLKLLWPHCLSSGSLGDLSKKKKKTPGHLYFLLCADLSAALEQPMGDLSWGTSLHQALLEHCMPGGLRGHSLFCSPVNKIRVLFPLLLCTDTDKILLGGVTGLGRTIDHCPNPTPEAVLYFSQRQQTEGGLCSDPNDS